MKTLHSDDINKIFHRILAKNENLNIFVGSGDNKKVIMKGGFKIRHIDSGLIYTVIKVILPKDDEGAKISCQRPGKKLIIPDSEFKKYERQ
jgi:hypothetical protein